MTFEISCGKKNIFSNQEDENIQIGGYEEINNNKIQTKSTDILIFIFRFLFQVLIKINHTKIEFIFYKFSKLKNE